MLAALVVLTASCRAIAKPDGWAGPVGDEQLLIVHEDGGVLAGVRLQEGTAPELLWRFPEEGSELKLSGVYAQPIVDGDRVYIVGFDGIAVALDVSGPRPVEVWPQPLELEADVVGTPVLDGQVLYVVTDSGELVSVDTATGSVLSRLKFTKSRIWSSPLLVSGVLYVAGLDERAVAAIAPGEDPAVRWQLKTTGAVRADLSLLGQLLIVGTFDGVLHAYDIDAEGDERWRFDGNGWFFAPPLVAGDRVYAATMRGAVYAIDGTGGTELWARTLEDSEFRSRPIVADRVLIVADRNGVITGLDLSDGRTVWSQTLEGANFDADPLILGQRVIFVTAGGEIVSIDPTNGATSRFVLGG